MRSMILATLALVGCGAVPAKGGYMKHLNDVSVIVLYGHQPSPNNKPTIVEPDLQEYFNDFLDDAARNGGKIHSGLQDVKWADILDSGDSPANTYTIGLCTYEQFSDGGLTSHVQILRWLNPDLQTPWDDVKLKTVLYHELGHCLLGLNHTAPDVNQIMEPVADMTNDYITANWDSLVKFEFDSEVK